jgi:ribosome maturation factor RimP
MHKKLTPFLGREVEVWTTENTEPWMGILKEADADTVCIMIDELETYIVTSKIVAFRLSEGEQGGEEGDEEEEDENEGRT